MGIPWDGTFTSRHGMVQKKVSHEHPVYNLMNCPLLAKPCTQRNVGNFNVTV